MFEQPIQNLITDNPVYADFFSHFGIKTERMETFNELIDTLSESFYEDNCTSQAEFCEMFSDFIDGLVAAEAHTTIHQLEVMAGQNKFGDKERSNLLLLPGEITCVVGPTGSGKSRLLADIEWLADADTPTKRRVLINGQSGDEDLVNTFGGKLIAQITQNMNFVLDVSVHEFLMLHAQSKLLSNPETAVAEVIELANELSGEQFKPDTPVTFLSGGQSRALMIADVSCIGQAPIVLIDEIENAGVNKKKALDLLVSKEKIVLMATHDPMLILLADKRVVIKNGGMDAVIKTNDKEKQLYSKLEALDNTIQAAKDFFRGGSELISSEQLPLPLPCYSVAFSMGNKSTDS